MRIAAGLLTCCSLIPAAWATEPEPPPDPELTEHVTVTATRLADEPDDADHVPANVTVVGREEIERLGLVDLAELLALETSAIFYDQTGNGVQTTFDMRGFTNGSGTRVYFDGVPVNDAVNNTLSLELFPLEALERVEITRGSAAALAGGGAEAGVINLVTRRGDGLDGALRAAGGTFDASDYGGWLSHATGPFDLLVSARRRETDGFRANADGDLSQLSARAGYDLGHDRRLSLTLADSESDYGNPGALTPTELEQDAHAAPYNTLDFSDQELGLASLGFRGPLAHEISLAANLFVRERDTESLSTGRSASSIGGFALDSDASFWGSTVQATHHHRGAGRENQLTVGGEWLDGDTDSQGFFTPPSDPGAVPDVPSTDTTAERRTVAFFVQDSFNPTERFTLLLGARHDADRVALDEAVPDPTNADSRRFSELSLRGGLTFNPDGRQAVYVSYGEGFLAPTAEDLFAFPGFGSNPELDPEDSRSVELGYRRRFASGQLHLDAGLFRIDTEDEIVFDPDSPLGPFGANVNAGEARRQGLELSLGARPHARVGLAADLTLTDAEFTSGAEDGNELPLVPRERLALKLDLDLPAGLSLHTDGLYVGEQVLDNDDANAQSELDDYVVVNARLGWRLDRASGPRRGLGLFVEARNLFDEEYATRGIYAFDSIAGANSPFLTPAPGRRYTAGAEWEF